MIALKPGVSIANLQPQALLAYLCAVEVYRETGEDACVLTSALDGKHSPGSLHYVGLAIDIRLPKRTDVYVIAVEIARRLGDECDEYQPTPPTPTKRWLMRSQN